MKRLDEIFDIKNSPSLELMNCEQVEDGICFVSRTEKNNGIVARIQRLDDLEPMPANAITVALGGSVLSSFYQDEPFYTSFHIACLYPKQHLTREQMIYYACIIEQNKYRYNFGRQANKTLKNILVPDIDKLPDFINKISISDFEFDEAPVLNKKISLNVDKWEWFRFDEIFDIHKGATLTKADMISGDIPFISATAKNNGVSATIANNEHLHKGNTISVSSNGSIGFAFYQPVPYWASGDNNVLHLKSAVGQKLNQHIAMFLCTLIEKERYRFNYGIKWGQKVMETSKIKLPVTPDGTPDWQMMENFIKSLSYSKLI